MEEADTESEADKSVDDTDIAADVETSSVNVAGRGKRKIQDEGAETRKKKLLCKRTAEKKQSIDCEAKSFIEGLVHSSVNSLGDILRVQMASMESMFKERMGNMESEVSQLREAISLSGEGSVPKSKTDEAPPKTKTVDLAPAKKKVNQAQAPAKKKFLTHMNTSRRHSYGVPSMCWCGKGVVIFYSRTDDNPYRRFYRCEIGAQVHSLDLFFDSITDLL
ncbi:hypothetical protein HID58_047486, partial [Brassica napus]